MGILDGGGSLAVVSTESTPGTVVDWPQLIYRPLESGLKVTPGPTRCRQQPRVPSIPLCTPLRGYCRARPRGRKTVGPRRARCRPAGKAAGRAGAVVPGLHPQLKPPTHTTPSLSRWQRRRRAEAAPGPCGARSRRRLGSSLRRRASIRHSRRRRARTLSGGSANGHEHAQHA